MTHTTLISLINASNLILQRNTDLETLNKTMASPVQISIWPRTVCDVSTGEIMADTSCPQHTESRKPKHRYRNFLLLYDISKRFIVEKTMDKLRVYRTNFTAPVHHSVALLLKVTHRGRKKVLRYRISIFQAPCLLYRRMLSSSNNGVAA